MRVLTIGMHGVDVQQWEWFLRGLGYPVNANGFFDEVDEKATKKYQRDHVLTVDGAPGPKTFAHAIDRYHFDPTVDPWPIETGKPKKDSAQWPPCPEDIKPISNLRRAGLFGNLDYTPSPTKANPEGITVDPQWVRDNIESVALPFAVPRGKADGPAVARVRINKRIAAQFAGLFSAWQEAGLAPRVLTWNGSYVPRFIRGSTESLSNHALGTAFDINVKWNGLNRRPALVGDYGSVRELVPLANKHGFYWGGHYQRRLDGMHFEAVKIL